MKPLTISGILTIAVMFLSFAPLNRKAFTPSETTRVATPIRFCGSINLDKIDGDVTAPLFQGLGEHHFPVTTRSSMAQEYFDQGLALVYGFNHMEALRSFKQAADFDPECAMAYWGQALTLGPNINLPMSDEYADRAFEAITKSMQLSSTCAEKEQDMIEALAARYTAELNKERAMLDQSYANKMKALADKYSADPDINTLYAAAVMNTMPWDYYITPTEPKPETVRVINTLERMMRMHPEHPGAHHYYIHIVEPSNTPERGLSSADKLGVMMPGSGHLVHMPSHIYIRTGFYKKAIEANMKAILADEDYIAHCQAAGVYPAGYYPHNIHFLYASSLFAGNSEMAISAARKAASKVPGEFIDDSHFSQEFLTARYHAFILFEKWNEMLTEPHPGQEYLHAAVVWHYGRGMAFFARNQHSKAEGEIGKLGDLISTDLFSEKYDENAETAKVAQIALNILSAQRARELGDIEQSITYLEAAKEFEDQLVYNEPATWSLPVRWILGSAYLKKGDAKRAEQAFREDLSKNRDNGWAIYGLMKSLEAQEQQSELNELNDWFDASWQWADVECRLLEF